MAPPMGAMNMLPIPAPMAEAMTILLSWSSSLKWSARNEPNTADISATGPSLPALPPEPMLTALAASFTAGVLFLILAERLWNALTAALIPRPSDPGVSL